MSTNEEKGLVKKNESLLNKIATIITVKPEDVIADAQEYGLNVQCLKDFTDSDINYRIIELMMMRYSKLAVEYSAFGGLLSGLGGLFSAVPLAISDVANLSAHMYRLSNRLCILHGLNPQNPTNFTESMMTFIKAMGFEGATKTAIKKMIEEALLEGGKRGPAKSKIIKIILWIAREIFKKQITKRTAGKIVPLIGGGIGYLLNKTYATKVSKTLISEYRNMHNALKKIT
jgi:hypothetical protein